MMGSASLQAKEENWLFLSPCSPPQQEDRKPGGKCVTDPNLTGTLILDASASRNGEKKCVLFKLPSQWYPLVGARAV